MTDQLLRSNTQAAVGPLVLDGETLIGIIVTTSYVFTAAHQYASEVTAYEVDADESRLTGTAATTLTDSAAGWLVTITGTSPVDLTGVDNRGGIVWVRPGGSDAARQIVGFAADIGPENAAYLPTWPDGLYAETIAPLVVGDPLALSDLTDTNTDGKTIGDALVWDGTNWVPDTIAATTATMPVLYQPDTQHGPGSTVRVAGIANLGTTEGQDAEAAPLTAGVIPAYAWVGLRLYSQIRSTVGTAGYPSNGFEFTATKVIVFERLYGSAGKWIEILTVHAYTDGDTDELHDYFEIAVVHESDGLYLGINIRCNGHLPEYKWVTPDPAPVEFSQEFVLHVTLNPATGVVEFFVDGVSAGSGVLQEAVTDDPPSLPLTLTAPAGTVNILTTRGPLVAESIKVTEYGATTVLIGVDAADSGGDRDTSFVSHGRTWTGDGGLVSLPFHIPHLPTGAGGWSSAGVDVGSSDSGTWVLAGFDPLGGTSVQLWYDRNLIGAVFSGQAGWGFAHAPGLDFGFLITSGGGPPVVADAGVIPTEPCLVAAVLDRAVDEVRLYVWTPTDGMTLAATSDASGLGAVTPSATATLNADLTGAASFYPRALTELQLENLALSVPT